MASCAVSLWSWSTSIKHATRLFAAIQMVKLNLCYDQEPIDSFQTYCTVIGLLYLNLRCHPNKVNQTHSLQTEFSGTSSYHDYHNRHHLSHHKKVGFLTV